MTDIEDEVTRYLQLTASAVDIRPDIEAAKSGQSARGEDTPPLQPVQERRYLVAVAAVCVVAASGWALLLRETPSATVAAGMSDSTTIPQEDDLASEAEASPPQPVFEDPARVVLAEGAGTTEPRYLRIWNHSASDDEQRVLLSEQWFNPAGVAIGATALIESSTVDDTWVDPAMTLRLGEVEVIREASESRDLGYPEKQLPTTFEEAATVFADGGELTPGVLMSVSTSGPDGSYLPGQATASVGNLTRLLPTIMEPETRRLAFDIASALHGAEVSDDTDLLDRAATAIAIPLEVADPSTGVDVGELNVTFWFDPDSFAILQIEWRLVTGTLGSSDTSQFVDTTVIVAAGSVANLPDLTEPLTENTTSTTTTPPTTE